MKTHERVNEGEAVAKPTSKSGKSKAKPASKAKSAPVASKAKPEDVKAKAVKVAAAKPAPAKAVAPKPAGKPEPKSAKPVTASHAPDHVAEPARRDFIHIAAASAAAVGGAAVVWPLVNQMNPSADTLALSSTEVDLASISEGSQITVIWRGKPVFVKHRSAKEIAEAKAVPMSDLKDPETDEQRAHDKDGKYRPEWLVMQGNCTHLGCVPLGDQGDYDGWFCPCHGSHYDTAGRIRKGPAPKNLPVPEYTFLSDTKIKIG